MFTENEMRIYKDVIKKLSYRDEDLQQDAWECLCKFKKQKELTESDIGLGIRHLHYFFQSQRYKDQLFCEIGHITFATTIFGLNNDSIENIFCKYRGLVLDFILEQPTIDFLEQKLINMCKNLSVTTQKVLAAYMGYLDTNNFKEICESLQLSKQTVANHVNKIKQVIQEQL